MHQEKKDPVGPHAPVDMAGTTPLGWASHQKSRGKNLQDCLFEPGDRSILPITPLTNRTGKSPWKHFHDCRDNLVFAFSEANGWTPRMEDRVVVQCPVVGRPVWSLFGVFDGHGGSFCSSYLAANLPAVIANEASSLSRKLLSLGVSGDNDTTPEVLEKLLTKVCVDLDKQLQTHPRMVVDRLKSSKLSCMDSSGSTGVIALVTAQLVAVANVGDSRAVLAAKPTTTDSHPIAPANAAVFNNNSNPCLSAIPLSRDHKPSLPEELARIEHAGCAVEEENDNCSQICCPDYTDVKLRMSRSFGDFYLKMNPNLPLEQQAVTSLPEVLVHRRSGRDAFLVLACDGVWDVMSNQEVVDFIANKLGFSVYGGPVGGISTQLAAETSDSLLHECLSRGSVDNLSAILVILGPPVSMGGGSSGTQQYHQTNISVSRRGSKTIPVNEGNEIDMTSIAITSPACVIIPTTPISADMDEAFSPLNSAVGTSNGSSVRKHLTFNDA